MFRKLKPTVKYDTIYDIDTGAMGENGIRAFFFDIDNTLEPYSTPKPGEKLSDWISGLIASGFKVGILSNAKRARIEKFVSGFPEEFRDDVLFLCDAGKPLKKGFKKLCAAAGAKPGQAAMVGDQLFTDILGGNRSGLTTVLVTPIDPSIEPPFVRFKRFFERPFL